jgi:CheY-like chemotaxis protein
MLKRWRMEPTSAQDSRAAIEILAAARGSGRQFRLVLIDGCMPGMDGFALVEELQRRELLSGTIIMMLTSSEQKAHATRCRELGISQYLVKPIRQSELLIAVRHSLGEGRKARQEGNKACLHSPTGGLRVLVAEDNPVNQKLAARMLQKLGHTVDIAKNGREALDLLEIQQFDIVLMDIQMPVMDGYSAVRALRGREKGTDNHIPIIALTAHAMSGDREKCLQAGMDDYLSKPVRISDLEQKLESHCGRPRLPSAVSMEDQSAEDANVSLVSGDHDLTVELAGIFLQELPKVQRQIQLAVENGDALALEHGSHKLKGSMAVFGARRAVQIAQEIEDMAAAGAVGQCEAAVQALWPEVQQMVAVLNHMFVTNLEMPANSEPLQ